MYVKQRWQEAAEKKESKGLNFFIFSFLSFYFYSGFNAFNFFLSL